MEVKNHKVEKIMFGIVLITIIGYALIYVGDNQGLFDKEKLFDFVKLQQNE